MSSTPGNAKVMALILVEAYSGETIITLIFFSVENLHAIIGCSGHVTSLLLIKIPQRDAGDVLS